jgi:tetratricopeptide (TPR) repeat protein
VLCSFVAKAEPAAPPRKRLLTPADALQVRKLEKQSEQHKLAARFSDALVAAQQVLAIRRRALGDGHWQTVETRLEVDGLKQIAALPRKAREELASAMKDSIDAVALHERSRFQEAGERFEKALQARRRHLGEEHLLTANSCQSLGNHLAALGRLDRAEPLLQKALAIHRKVLGEQSPRTAGSYDDLAACWHRLGRFADAEPLFARALATRRLLLGEEDDDTLVTCNNRAVNLHALGKYVEAEPFYKAVLDVRIRKLGEKNADTGTSYNNLAMNRYARGDYPAAEKGFRRALEIFRAAGSENHHLTALGYNNVAMALEAQARYEEAETLQRKALEIRRKLFTPEHLQTAASLNNLAWNLRNQAKYGEAERLMRDALAIYRREWGEQHPDTATIINNLALILNAQARYADAEPLMRKVLEVRRRALSEGHAETGIAFVTLGNNLAERGRYVEAQPLLQRGLAVLTRAVGEDHAYTAAAATAVAWTLEQQESLAPAEPLYRAALRARRKVLGQNHPDTLTSQINLAVNLLQQGKRAEADQLFRDTAERATQILGPANPVTLSNRNCLAFVLYQQGRFAEAEGVFRRVLEGRRRIHGELHPTTALAYGKLAGALEAQGKDADAEPLRLASARAFQASRQRVAFAGLDRIPFAATDPHLLALAALLARRGKPAEAWQWLEEGMAGGLAEELLTRQTRLLTEKEKQREQELFAGLLHLDRRVGLLLALRERTPAQHALLEKLSRQRDAAQAELSQFEAQMAAVHGVAAGQVYRQADVQAQLPAECALVAWLDVSTARPATGQAAKEHWACVLRQRGEPVWVKLSGSGSGGAWTAEDDTLPERLRQQFRGIALGGAAHRLGARPSDPSGWQSLAEALAVQRLEPLVGHLGEREGLPAVRHLIVLPSPPLAGIPIEALTPRYSVSYSPSGTVFAWLRQRKPSASAGLLALGDPLFPAQHQPARLPDLPAYGIFILQVVNGSNAERGGVRPDDVLLSYAGLRLKGPADLGPAMEKAAGRQKVEVELWRAGKVLKVELQPGRLGIVYSNDLASVAVSERRSGDEALRSAARSDRIAPLPGSRKEVLGLAALFESGEVRTLLGAQASDRRLAELAGAGELRRYRYLHLATHGKADPARGLRSYLILAHEAPGGPGNVGADEARDGRLTAEEILHTWQLDCDLVTLSACETGLGQASGSEGYLGFAQALFLAGSRSMVLGMWRVDDRATSLLMRRFYESLRGRRKGLDKPLSRAAALAEAQRWLRGLSAEKATLLLGELAAGSRGEEVRVEVSEEEPRPFAHPHYWAGFTLVGDPGDTSQVVPVLADWADGEPSAGSGPASVWRYWPLAAVVLLAGVAAWRLRRRSAR